MDDSDEMSNALKHNTYSRFFAMILGHLKTLLTLNSLPGVQNREIVAQMMAKVPFF